MMKKRRLNRKTVKAVFIATAVLLVFTTVGAVRAALASRTEFHVLFELHDIGVTLNENGEPVAWRTYDGNKEAWDTSSDTASLLADVKQVRYGETYDEELTVTNSGRIDEYVRVTVYKYWVDEEGNKASELDPGLIDLKLVSGDNGWIVDDFYTTDERTILYYTAPLKGSDSAADGETSEAFAESVAMDGKIKDHVAQVVSEYDETTGYTTYTTDYIYDGYTFCVDVQVDAIQTHNAEDAAMSAWGRKISIASDGTLSLVEG